MASMRKLTAAILALTALAGGGMFLALALNTDNVQPQFATVWPMPREFPEFRLTDQDGNEFTNEDLRGKWSLLFFGFTHCPDICPATLQQLAIANKQISANGHIVPRVVLVSVDPERDTPEVLQAYTGHFGGEISGITGDLAELKKLTSAAGIFFQKSELPDGNYSVDHSAVVLVIDEAGAIHASFGAPHDVDYFVNDIPILMESG
jgi:protein SCO1/2